jgi:glutathione S-transferase
VPRVAEDRRAGAGSAAGGDVTARLYVTSLSNPSKAAAAMVSYKRLPHRRVNLLSGFHPMLVRAAGFQGRTVPALELDGRHVQDSLEISRALDEAIAERPLFPPEPFARRSVESGGDEATIREEVARPSAQRARRLFPHWEGEMPYFDIP